MADLRAKRLRRLAEELEEAGLRLEGTGTTQEVLMEEIDRALRPTVHERRAASTGTIFDPTTDPASWASGTQLDITRTSLAHHTLSSARLFADGLSSWLLRRADGSNEWIIFDRPAGSERDLVVLGDVFDATLVQRHPTGAVRVVGRFGVFRWEGLSWHHEPPVRRWIDTLASGSTQAKPEVLEAMLEFAVHDLGSMGIGALLVHRSRPDHSPPVEERLPTPPALKIDKASHLAPLRHALAQVDGAAVFDANGVLRQLGVRLVPTALAEERVEPLGGTRHTSGRRYSYDDPFATVIVVSEDGPVSVLRGGAVLTQSSRQV